MKIAPAFLILETNKSSFVDIEPAIIGDPSLVYKSLAYAKSLTACGIPCIQPLYMPFSNSKSAFFAWSIRMFLSTRLTIALYVGLYLFILERYSCITSSQLMTLSLINVDKTEADMSVISFIFIFSSREATEGSKLIDASDFMASLLVNLNRFFIGIVYE